MNSTNVSQLELCGMAVGGRDRAESPTPTKEGEATRALSTEGRSASGSEIGSRATDRGKPKAARNLVEPGAIEALLNFADAARTLGISLRQFRRLVDGGKIAFVKVSERAPRVRPSELQRFLTASAVKYSEVQS